MRTWSLLVAEALAIWWSLASNGSAIALSAVGLIALVALVVAWRAYVIAQQARQQRRGTRPVRDQLTPGEQKERFAAMGEKLEADKDHDYVRAQRTSSGERPKVPE